MDNARLQKPNNQKQPGPGEGVQDCCGDESLACFYVSVNTRQRVGRNCMPHKSTGLTLSLGDADEGSEK